MQEASSVELQPSGSCHDGRGSDEPFVGLHAELERNLEDASIVITTPFHPAYMTRERIEKAKKLKLILTAGIGSDHIDLHAAADHGLTVAECVGALQSVPPVHTDSTMQHHAEVLRGHRNTGYTDEDLDLYRKCKVRARNRVCMPQGVTL